MRASIMGQTIEGTPNAIAEVMRALSMAARRFEELDCTWQASEYRKDADKMFDALERIGFYDEEV